MRYVSIIVCIMRCVVRIKVQTIGTRARHSQLKYTIYFVCEIEWKFRRRIQTANHTHSHSVHTETHRQHIFDVAIIPFDNMSFSAFESNDDDVNVADDK